MTLVLAVIDHGHIAMMGDTLITQYLPEVRESRPESLQLDHMVTRKELVRSRSGSENHRGGPRCKTHILREDVAVGWAGDVNDVAIQQCWQNREASIETLLSILREASTDTVTDFILAVSQPDPVLYRVEGGTQEVVRRAGQVVAVGNLLARQKYVDYRVLNPRNTEPDAFQELREEIQFFINLDKNEGIGGYLTVVLSCGGRFNFEPQKHHYGQDRQLATVRKLGETKLQIGFRPFEGDSFVDHFRHVLVGKGRTPGAIAFCVESRQEIQLAGRTFMQRQVHSATLFTEESPWAPIVISEPATIEQAVAKALKEHRQRLAFVTGRPNYTLFGHNQLVQ
ncbi:hypothetical protein [Glycomyces tarimensis]